MYSIDRHIASLKNKGEEWAAEQVEAVRTEVEKYRPFKNDAATFSLLTIMMARQKEKRDKFEEFSVDYQLEWSILLIIENMKHLVKVSLEEKNEK